jgi:pentalenolactone synthase
MTDESVRRVTTRVGDSAWQVSRYETVKALLCDPRLGRSHPEPEAAARLSESVLLGQAVGSPETEQAQHAWMRKVLTPAFSAQRMARIRPRVQELAEGLFDDLSRATPPTDFHEKVSFPLPVLVICELLGVAYEDREGFRRWSQDAADMADRARSQAGWSQLQSYMSTLIERKREEPAQDVLSDLAAVHDRSGAGASYQDLTQLAAGLLFAGHETTVAAIDKGVLLLLQNPDQREALLRDPELVSSTVEEILRHPLRTSVPSGSVQDLGLPRWAKTDIEVEGVTIPAGDLVLLNNRAANLDDHVFDHPEAFDVTRADNPHLAFGHGPRFCVGAPLARIELQTVFGTLLQRFPTLRLAVPVEELRPRSDLLTGGLLELPVTW